MIVLFILLPVFLVILLEGIQTIIAKRVLRKNLGNSEFILIQNLYGFYDYQGRRVILPSTPMGKLEAYLLEDLIIITGKTNMLWLFEAQKMPLILLRPRSLEGHKYPRVQKVQDYKVYESRIRINFSFKGVSKVQYTLGVNRGVSNKDRECLKKWFGVELT